MQSSRICELIASRDYGNPGRDEFDLSIKLTEASQYPTQTVSQNYMHDRTNRLLVVNLASYDASIGYEGTADANYDNYLADEHDQIQVKINGKTHKKGGLVIHNTTYPPARKEDEIDVSKVNESIAIALVLDTLKWQWDGSNLVLYLKFLQPGLVGPYYKLDFSPVGDPTEIYSTGNDAYFLIRVKSTPTPAPLEVSFTKTAFSGFLNKKIAIVVSDTEVQSGKYYIKHGTIKIDV